jgi:hypothetical protein
MVTHKTSCPQCHGLRMIYKETIITCQRCQGTGKFLDIFGNTYDTVYGPLLCYRCRGRKQITASIENPCERCQGTGSIDQEKPPLLCTTIKFTVHLVDEAGTCIDLNLKEVMNQEFGTYLTEFMTGHIYIDSIIIKVSNNNTILCAVTHSDTSDTSDDLLRCIRDYIEEDAPTSDFLNLFYQDAEQNYFSLVMDAVSVEDLPTIDGALEES